MICPRCSVGEISDQTHECTLCGFAPSSVITLATPFPREVEESVRQELEQQFQIEGVLGRGPRSIVYLALERGRDRLVALKIIPRAPAMPPEAATAFQREVTLAATLDHPHILPIYGSGVTRVLLWYAMEYCNARSLADVLGDGGGTAMDLAGCLRVAQQAASALDYAHRRGITHGGLTPHNILIDGRGWVRVSDFGVRRAFGRPGGDAAELRYFAPECFAPRNLAGPSADQYALAVVAYDCLGGFAAPPPPAGAASPHGRPSPTRLELPPSLFDALQRATSEQPSARFATVLDFVVALEGGSERAAAVETRPSLPVAAAPPSPAPTPTPAPASGRRHSPTRRSSGAPPPLVVIDDEPAPPPPGPPRRRLPRVIGWVGGIVLALFAAGLTWLFWPVGAQHAPTLVLQPVQTLGGEGLRPDSAAAAANAAPAPTAPIAVPGTARPPAASPPPPARRVIPGGKLFIAAMPWAELSIDGRYIGNTPRANLELPAGVHRIHLARDGYLPFDTTITVASGSTVRLTDVALKLIVP